MIYCTVSFCIELASFGTDPQDSIWTPGNY